MCLHSHNSLGADVWHTLLAQLETYTSLKVINDVTCEGLMSEALVSLDLGKR